MQGGKWTGYGLSRSVFVILARNYMCSLMMISSMLSKHVGAVKVFLKKWFKNKLHTISEFVGFVIIIESVQIISSFIKIWHEWRLLYIKTNIHIFSIISRSVLLKMKNVLDKTCRENYSTYCTFNNFFFLNRDLCEKLWKNNVEPGRARMTIWRMRDAC